MFVDATPVRGRSAAELLGVSRPALMNGSARGGPRTHMGVRDRVAAQECAAVWAAAVVRLRGRGWLRVLLKREPGSARLL